LEDEGSVGGHEERVELEGELRGIRARVELAELVGLTRKPFEERQPFALLGGDRVAQRTGAGADVGRGRREETAAGKTRRSTCERNSSQAASRRWIPFGAPSAGRSTSAMKVARAASMVAS
jgi:hypothetical protein